LFEKILWMRVQSVRLTSNVTTLGEIMIDKRLLIIAFAGVTALGAAALAASPASADTNVKLRSCIQSQRCSGGGCAFAINKVCKQTEEGCTTFDDIDACLME
jgi:hypothetical protein